MEEHKELSRFEYVQSKIREGIDFDRHVAYWHFLNEKIVFIHGVFDQITPKEVELIYNAAQQGSVLIVGLHCGEGVQAQNSAEDRALVLAALECVECVVLTEPGKVAELTARINPSINL